MGPAQLGEWFDACGASLVLYARQWLQAGSAEDVVQDVFVRLISQRQPPEHVKAWLFQSVRNAAISRLRGRRRRQKYQQRLATEAPLWFEARPGDLIDAQAAQAALEALPQNQREIVVLRIWGGMTLKQIAQIVGRPISTVFHRYRSGLTEIRQRMETSCKTKSN